MEPQLMNWARQPTRAARKQAFALSTMLLLAGTGDVAVAQNNDRFGAAFEGTSAIGRPVAQFECQFQDEIVFGLPVMGRPTRPYFANITVYERGHAAINGTILEPEAVRH